MSQFEEENTSTWTSYPLSKDDRNKERTNTDEKVKCLWDGVIKRQKEMFRKMKKEKDKWWQQRWRRTAQTRALNHSRQSRSTMYKLQCTQILSTTTVGCTTPGVIDSSSHTSRGSQRLDCHPRSAYFLSVRTKTTCQRCELGGATVVIAEKKSDDFHAVCSVRWNRDSKLIHLRQNTDRADLCSGTTEYTALW